ncbi:MAG: tol-pal system protein YbgF [Proteobacteria bacterium]|uniref:tol-pal system protein YbgF n=1 Tax=Aquabacterium sp. TaxID=1872578 RepID=UPI0035C6F465|nr:tol-pal system protein YbgF [Pseudomonadota bacterium]
MSSRLVSRGAVAWSGWAVVLAAAFSPMAAQAGIFDDDEARRAILDLRQQRTQDTDALNAQIKALSAQVDVLKRSLLEMNATIEQLRGELASSRGGNEVLQRDVAELQRKQKDAQASLDERMRKLEPQSVTVDGKTFLAEADEKRDFDEALARLRAADFTAGAAALNSFLKRYPNTGYRESAQYWQGNAHYGLREYKEAIQSFKALVERAPDHARTPEALLSIANCQVELKDSDAARRTLEQLVKQYPQTEAAQAARDRLLTMSSAGKPRKGK